MPPIFAPPCPFIERIAPPPVVVAPSPPSTSFFPAFNKALDISNRLGIPTTVQTLKRLEISEKTKDPCHSNRHALLPQRMMTLSP
jgi:hypothetical protein